MRLGILTCTWKRPDLTEIMLRHTASLGYVRVAVRSPEDPEPFREVAGWQYVDASNDLLSRKWTRGMMALRILDVDAVMILGSDDFVNEAYVNRVRSLLEEKESDYLQPGGLWVYDAITNRCMYGTAQRIGAGRVLSKRLLDLLDWQPWKRANLGMLDGAMDARVTPLVFPYRLLDMPLRGEVLVDVKTQSERSDAQAWTFNDLRGLTRGRYEPERFWRHYFPNIADDVLNLYEVNQW